MHDNPDRTRPRLLAATLIALLLAAGCSGEADPADYFEAFDQSQTELDASVSALFSSPVAQEVDAFLDDTPETLEADQDALVQQFVTEFWTGTMDALALHREQLADVSVPSSVQSAHDNYTNAIDAMLDTRDPYLAEVAASSGADLLATFWDPGREVQDVNDTCRAIVEIAESDGFTITSPICSE